LGAKHLARKFTTAPNGTPIIGIVGWKKSGKTTLAVRLIEYFSQRGFKVASVKHAHHQFYIDDGETDSARHRTAGAQQVAIVSGKRWAIVSELDGEAEPDFMDVIGMLDPADVIVVEGYKSAGIAKIEARRTASTTRTSLERSDPLIIAVASDHEVTSSHGLPVFALDDIAGIAALVETTIGPIGKERGELWDGESENENEGKNENEDLASSRDDPAVR